MLFGQNLVTNGDFTAGNTGFTSDYRLGLPVGGASSVYGSESYSITASAGNVHGSWAHFPDHTTGTSAGRYLVANGSSDVTKTVWQSTLITVASAKTPYRFEAWISSVYPLAPSILTFEIGNGSDWVELGTTASLSNSKVGEWLHTYADAQFSKSGKYYVRLKNANNAEEGNDFGIDDIYFGLRKKKPSAYGFRRVNLRDPKTWAQPLFVSQSPSPGSSSSPSSSPSPSPGSSPSPPMYSPKPVGDGAVVAPDRAALRVPTAR